MRTSSARPDPHTQEKAESEKVRYADCVASRPLHTQEKAESEKGGTADWVKHPDPTTHKRRQRARR
jgi:hypothetical protein